MIRLELNQSRLRGGQRVPQAAVRRAMREVSGALRLRRSVRISAAFVSPREMRRLNRLYRGRDRVTDVLSFPFAADEDQGEVLLSYETAQQQAAEMGHGVRDEVLFLLVHGVLHAFGYDHETPRQAAKMFPLQARVLARLGIDPRL